MSPLYFAVMLRVVPPPPPPELPPPQPESEATAIRKNASPVQAHCLRRAGSFAANQRLSAASSALSNAKITKGVWRGGRKSMTAGGSAISAVGGSVAVQDAPVELVAAAGVHVTAGPKLALPLRNCTVPVGLCVELLVELTVAVKPTVPPEVMLVVLGTAAVVVVAWVMVMVLVAEVLPVKLWSPAYTATILFEPAGSWIG